MAPSWKPEEYEAWKARQPKGVSTPPPHPKLSPIVTQAMPKADFTPIPAKRRIRQSQKPPTKLESDGLLWLKAKYPDPIIRWHTQAWRVRIANGAWYKVDICAQLLTPFAGRYFPEWHAWETKCLKGKNAARGILALKCAASAFPEVVWHLLTKENGQFQDQIILP